MTRILHVEHMLIASKSTTLILVFVTQDTGIPAIHVLVGVLWSGKCFYMITTGEKKSGKTQGNFFSSKSRN